LAGLSPEPFGNNNTVIQGTPADVDQGKEKQPSKMLNNTNISANDLKYSKGKIIKIPGLQQAIKAGRLLTQKKMKTMGRISRISRYPILPYRKANPYGV
jgi:hypothetical protein